MVALTASKTPISRGALFRLMLWRKTVRASFFLLDETESILYRDFEEFLTFVEKMSSFPAKCARRQFHAHDGQTCIFVICDYFVFEAMLSVG